MGKGETTPRDHPKLAGKGETTPRDYPKLAGKVETTPKNHPKTRKNNPLWAASNGHNLKTTHPLGLKFFVGS